MGPVMKQVAWIELALEKDPPWLCEELAQKFTPHFVTCHMGLLEASVLSSSDHCPPPAELAARGSVAPGCVTSPAHPLLTLAKP